MNQRVVNILPKLISFLQKKYDEYTRSANAGVTAYHSLSPINDADSGEYETALLWALQHRKDEDIKNVALTGPYGSGKSSILKTFEEKHKHQYNFLSISLATFKEELAGDKEEPKEGVGTTPDKDVLRLIELSILQQIFYHEEDGKIPDSRFKKIRSFKRSSLVFIASSVLVLMICCFDLFAPDKFKSVFHLKLSDDADLVVHLASLFLFIVGAYIILLRSVRLFNSIKISKFKFKDAEIEIDKGINKSILNNHLDEILYFFEVTPYDVVIIEDLDRFQQTEIFTKLRELNLLINNSKKIKREIVFIYAVRDDMFRDKDRTKFFDFIVPVIPVINSSNSNEKLLGVIKKNGYALSDDLVDDISLFIDDMRLLYNITNEYHIYHHQLDKGLPQDKLLAMIVYKNIHPNDFVSLSKGEGILFETLNGRKTYIKSVTDRLDAEIAIAKSEIKEIDELQINDIMELRRLYILEYASQLSGIISFEINGATYAVNNVLDDAQFDYFKKNKARYNHYGHSYSNYYVQVVNVVTPQFAEIEKAVDPDNTYVQREARIKGFHAGKTETLKSKIAKLEKEKTAARHIRLKELISGGNSKIQLADEKQNLLVNILLQNGYIDEDYLDYISIFYEGSITKEDRQFLLNVKSQIALDFDFKLKKIAKLVPKIGQLEFGKNTIFNYNLLDYLLQSSGQASKLQALIEVMANQSDRSISFIEGFIDNGKQVAEMVLELSKKWPGWWKYIHTESAFTQDRQVEYFRLIMNHAELPEITALAKDSDLRSFTEGRADFLTLLDDPDKIKAIVTEMQLKFTGLVFTGAPEELTNFIYEGDYYALSTEMLKRVMEARGAYSESDFATQNYAAIQNSAQAKLVKYVDANIDAYISDIYLTIESNIDDPEPLMITLLNNTDISQENRVAMIERMSVKITDISSIEEPEIQEALLNHSKLDPVWNNLIPYYHYCDDEFDDAAIAFIELEENADELSAVKVKKDVPDEELVTVKKFLRSLIAEEKLSDESYGKLVKSVPYSYTSATFENISLKKVDSLINSYTLGITPENFKYLKEHFEGKHITLLEKRHIDFVKKIPDFELEESDQVALLRSAAFSLAEKQLIYESLSDEEIVAGRNLAAAVGKILVDNPSWVINKDTLKHILTHSLSIPDRVQLFNTRFRSFGKADITEILSSWPYPYSDIAVLGKRPVLDHGRENGFLANNLAALGYISKLENERKGVRISTFKK